MHVGHSSTRNPNLDLRKHSCQNWYLWSWGKIINASFKCFSIVFPQSSQTFTYSTPLSPSTEADSGFRYTDLNLGWHFQGQQKYTAFTTNQVLAPVPFRLPKPASTDCLQIAAVKHSAFTVLIFKSYLQLGEGICLTISRHAVWSQAGSTLCLHLGQ